MTFYPSFEKKERKYRGICKKVPLDLKIAEGEQVPEISVEAIAFLLRLSMVEFFLAMASQQKSFTLGRARSS